jgi:hypothetical protein
MRNTTKFDSIVLKYTKELMAETGFSQLDACAVWGNLGHESNGMLTLQEVGIQPPKGGWSWAQWTGIRRVNFTKWCAKNGIDIASDEAAYRYLILELAGPEKGAIAKTKAAGTLNEKVIAFELGFERAGVKHYDSRQWWAERAWEVLMRTKAPPVAPPVAPPAPVPPIAPAPAPATPPKSKAAGFIVGAAIVVVSIIIILLLKGH